jgi:malonyl-CoA O-methyltransferase
MTLSHNQIVARAFAAHVKEYERNAQLQEKIAARLGGLFPPLKQPKILEIGCGTGFLTRHLLNHYSHGDFLITDIVPEMVTECRAHYQSANGRAIRFSVMDGEAPNCDDKFDLIALSMTLQWFTDPLEGLQRLKRLLSPGGHLLFATTGPESFPEWRAALDAGGLRHGMIAMPHLPEVVEEETRVVNYGSGVDFLKALKAIGATTPRPGYEPMSPGGLRAALRCLEQNHQARVTWQIVYGLISA